MEGEFSSFRPESRMVVPVPINGQILRMQQMEIFVATCRSKARHLHALPISQD